MAAKAEKTVAPKIATVVCYWKWAWNEKKPKEPWRFVEAYAVDGKWNPLTPVKNPPKKQRAKFEDREWRNWMYNGGGMIKMPGRAVTLWTVVGGVRLLSWSPAEGDSAKWADYQFFNEIRHSRTWYTMLAGGHAMYHQTAREVEKLIGLA